MPPKYKRITDTHLSASPSRAGKLPAMPAYKPVRTSTAPSLAASTRPAAPSGRRSLRTGPPPVSSPTPTSDVHVVDEIVSPPLPLSRQSIPLATQRMKTTTKRKSDQAESSTSKRFKFTFDDIAIVIVGDGDDQKTFKVHKQALCESSRFFKAALTGERWTESIDGSIKLPDHSPEIFQGYVQLCYNDSTRPNEIVKSFATARMEKIDCGKTEEPAEDRELREHFEIMADIWVLGDYLGNGRVMNAVMRDLLESAVLDSVIMASSGVETSPLWQPGASSTWRRWLVDAIAATVTAGDVQRCGEVWPADFTRAVLQKFVELSGTCDQPEPPEAFSSRRYFVEEDSP